MMGMKTVRRGERVAVWSPSGDVRFVDGPQRLLLWRDKVQPLKRFRAEPHQYLVIRYLDGHTEHRRGPAEVWWDPAEHESISHQPLEKLDANEALVIYRRETDDTVKRTVLCGPALYAPGPDEWLHEFCWHGADPQDPTKKLPRALRFTQLRVIPDQLYFDVRDVRTSDDALLLVKLMVFFELRDIERMLDQTHDPIADFINALSADVIDFAADRNFEEFKEATGSLSDLNQYQNLTGRAERIGYRINKVVYRGYVASAKLQLMHDEAIERRTALKLEAETQRQAQELADLKLAREAQRDAQRQAMVRTQTEHEESLTQLRHEGELVRSESQHRQHLLRQREEQTATVEHVRAENEARLEFLQQIQGMQVDLTRYLVAQYQHPDRFIRVEGGPGPQLHLHGN